MVDQAEIRWKAVSGDFKERREAVKQLRHNFAKLPDKEGAWNDLIQLAMGDRSILALGERVSLFEAQCVQLDAVDALGDVFQYIHDKKRIWKDLIRVTQSDPNAIDDGGVKWHAVCVLDAVFQQYPDKEHALKDLHRFAYDKDSYVRASANYSLGKAHIFKATETEGEEDFRKEINNALNFFEKSSSETDYFNPSSFCLPFYRSFYTITFEKARAEDEVRKYLAEAKSASEGSQSKEHLLEATENLAKALSEAQSLREAKLDDIQHNLNTCRQYCDRAADLIGDAAEGAPDAARVLWRGLPIVDQKIKELLAEVKKKSESICKAADLPESELGCRIGQHATTALATDNPLILEREIDHILNDLEIWSHSIRDENEKGYVQGIIFDAKNGDARGKVSTIRVLLGRLLPFSEDGGEEMSKYDIRDSIIQIAEGDGSVQKMDSSVNSHKAETESGDVTVTHNDVVTKESHPEEHRTDHQKKTAIEISADIAVHVLVYTVLHHFAEDLMSIIAPILVITALITLILIIHNAKSR